ncbi:hypothetical protein TNCV_3488011 [Trichonephila clavipes]|nr:hypothetical protein TNCV_3488011 [Trichonephila clavipes]
MDVCKCIVPSQHGGTLNSHRVESPLVRLVTGNDRWEAPDPPPGCPPTKLGWNRAKLYCHMYGAQGYGSDRRTSSPLPGLISWTWIWLFQTGGISNDNNNTKQIG